MGERNARHPAVVLSTFLCSAQHQFLLFGWVPEVVGLPPSQTHPLIPSALSLRRLEAKTTSTTTTTTMMEHVSNTRTSSSSSSSFVRRIVSHNNRQKKIVTALDVVSFQMKVVFYFGWVGGWVERENEGRNCAGAAAARVVQPFFLCPILLLLLLVALWTYLVFH